MTESTTAAAGEARLDELEASFLSCEATPAVHAALVLVPPAELTPPGAREDRALMPTVRTRSSRCC
jgi:hypothetical protein